MTKKFDVIEWMAEHGHPEYASQIHAARCVRSEIIGEAGRYWQFCEFTRATLAKIDAEIEDIRQRAADRFEDWASD